MKLKPLLIHIIILSFIYDAASAATGTGNQTDIDNCARLFPEAHCATWNARTSKICGCASCDPYFHSTQMTLPQITREGYTLIDECYCGTCRCSANPNTSKQNGTCTCGSNGANFDTCTASVPCSSSTCTNNWYATINGTYYCSTNVQCNSNIPGARVAYYVSAACSGGKGLNNDRCAVAQCASGTPSTDKSACVCYSGTYGKITSTSSTCTDCPGGGTSDVNFHQSLGPYSIYACYLPSGTTFSNTTGSGKVTDKCYY